MLVRINGAIFTGNFGNKLTFPSLDFVVHYRVHVIVVVYSNRNGTLAQVTGVFTS